MSSAPSPEEIWKDARWLAQAVDPNAGLVRVLEMRDEDYRRESFLDDRLIQARREAHLLKWADVEAAMPGEAPSGARWIFHIGHVGSTLVSRLLGELDSVLALREPRALRDLTFFPGEVRDRFVPTVRNLMSRTFGPEQTSIVKATSMVSQIAADLMGEEGRALFLFAPPETYLRTMLAGERAQSELQSLAAYYDARANAQRIRWPRDALAPADIAARVWACEMAALEDTALARGGVLWLDFDDFLKRPIEALTDVARFFGLSEEQERIAGVAEGPLMRRYSKALDHEFGPEARRQLLEEAGARHRPAIQSALALLQQAAEKAPALARALDRSNPDR